MTVDAEAEKLRITHEQAEILRDSYFPLPESPIRVTTEVDVQLISTMGDDEAIARAAMVSTGHQADAVMPEKLVGLLKYLMKSRHGSPFEHGALTAYVAGPIFVFREFHRHRIGFSYNEMSGRYTELEPLFYLPGPERPMVNAGTSARPKMVAAEPELTAQFNDIAIGAYEESWRAYKELLGLGVAKEMARTVLPVGIFSRMYVTCNPRSLMAFLSLRTHEPAAAYPSHPQYEIELVARKLEAIFASTWPVTYEAFNEAGRVSP